MNKKIPIALAVIALIALSSLSLVGANPSIMGKQPILTH